MEYNILLLEILKDSKYNLSIFTEDEIDWLVTRIFEKETKSGIKYFTKCIIRNKDIQLKPEEIIRQLYAHKLMRSYNYPSKHIAFEHPIHFGRQVKKADIVIFDKDRPTTEYIIIELKKPKATDGKHQLKSYTNATGAPIAVWTNGNEIIYYHRKDPNYFEEIYNIPDDDQALSDILNERFTLKDLIIHDKLLKQKRSLKSIIKDMEDEVLANAGVDVFEEVFKLIFTKLFDEYKSRDDKEFLKRHLKRILKKDFSYSYELIKKILSDFDDNDFRVMEFRNSGQTDAQLKSKIQKLFDEAKSKWTGIFPDNSEIQLTPSHLSICVSSLQEIKLFNSNLQIVDEAFEYLVNKSSKGEKGQYFTPRHVIDMCVKMLNPERGEYMIDTASGSCGFPVHTIFKITGHLFSNIEIPKDEKDNVLKIFGIDFDEKAVRVARTLNLIAGDGETNVLHLNTLDYDNWDERIKDIKWFDTYGKGFKRLEKLQKDKNSYKEFVFDILMANPPFAGDIKETKIIHKYDLGFKENGKPQNKMSRDVLFIERNLNFVKPGGRVALVLPQGRFNNTTDQQVREFISERARILAVVSLGVNTFKPHTGTKTSVIFLQKWNDDPKIGALCPKVGDYPIFLAVSEKSGKDNSGEYVYVKEENGLEKLDNHGHLITDHDLHNHDGELNNGIAEAFIDFAKSQNFSFWCN
jgi:type I restriction enzyme M protein